MKGTITEEWKVIDGYEGRYKISNFGNVLAFRYNKWKPLKGVDNRVGYFRVGLWDNYKHKFCYIHRLVAMYFIPNPLNYKEVNHIDCNPSNNHISNLEWVTPSMNIYHSYEKGKRDKRRRVMAVSTENECAIFKSITEAAKVLNINRPNINKCLSGIRHSAPNMSRTKRYKFIYINKVA